MMLSFCKGKAALFFKFARTLGGVNFCIGRFFSANFLDLSIWILVWALRFFEEVTRSSIEAPVSIEISSFINECHQCDGLGHDLDNLLVE
jgi:hypothetical protein